MGVWRCGNKGKPGATPCILHNTFDCQFSRYNPRLDAIMYYNMINGVAVKRFVDEVRHANGVQSYLFRDETGDCLHVLWKEGARVDCGVPLPGVETARLIRIDGGEVAMKPAGGVITLGLSGEPVLLRYRQQEPAPLPRVDGSAEIILPLTIMSPVSIDLVGDLVLGD